MNSILNLGGWEWLDNTLEWFGNIFVTLLEFLNQLVRMVFVLLYLIFAAICYVIEFAEIVFKRIAGIEEITVNGESFGGATDGGQDLVYAFITNEAVMNVFWSIIALSLVLLLVFTIVAMIKSEFTLDLKGSAKGPIIGRAFKSIVNLIAVPAISIIAILGVNFLTRTIYDLFEGDSVSLTAKCFQLAATPANRARTDEDFVDYISSGEWAESGAEFGGLGDEAMAEAIDEYFMDGHESSIVFKNIPAFEKGLQENYSDWFTLIMGYPKANANFSRADVKMVNYFYDLAEFQFILGIGSAVAIAWIMLTVCLVLIKRIFELTILFLLAPPMIAIAPLDGGQAEKKWRGEFTKRLLSVVGTVFAYNMYFLLLPIFQGITIFTELSGVGNVIGGAIDSAGAASGLLSTASKIMLITFDYFFQVICIVVGLSIVKSASALVSSLLGIEDLVKSGGEAAKKAVNVATRVAAPIAGAAGMMTMKGAAMAFKLGTAPAKAATNSALTSISRAKAKSQLAEHGAEYEANKKQAQNQFAAADASYQEAKQRKDRIDELEKKGNDITAEESAELAGLKESHNDAEFRALEKARNAAKNNLDNATRTLDYRKDGISSGKQKRMEMAASAKSKAAGASKWVENHAKNIGNTLLGDKDKVKNAEQRADAIESAQKGAYNTVIGKGESSWKNSVGGRNILKNIGRAWSTEFGEDAKNQSVTTKMAEAVDAVANAKIFGVKLSNVPLLSKGADLSSSFKDMMTVDPKDLIRRLNDGITRGFGDGGGGDLYKMWWHKNTRANLYQSVPEEKKRQAKIENEMTMEARDAYTKKAEEKADRKSQEKLLRRMVAEENLSGQRLQEYMDAQQKLEKGGLNKAEIQKLEAKIEKLEIAEGIDKEAKHIYENSGPGSKEMQKLQDYKDKLQTDAAVRAYAQEKKDKSRIAQAALANGDKPEMKVAEQSTEKLAQDIAKEIAKALRNDKEGMKISANQPIKIQADSLSDLASGITSMKDVITGLADAIKKLNGDK